MLDFNLGSSAQDVFIVWDEAFLQLTCTQSEPQRATQWLLAQLADGVRITSLSRRLSDCRSNQQHQRTSYSLSTRQPNQAAGYGMFVAQRKRNHRQTESGINNFGAVRAVRARSDTEQQQQQQTHDSQTLRGSKTVTSNLSSGQCALHDLTMSTASESASAMDFSHSATSLAMGQLWRPTTSPLTAPSSAAAATTAAIVLNSLPVSSDVNIEHNQGNYPCRICGMALSSSSNRLRHERAKHKTPDPTSSPTADQLSSAKTGPGDETMDADPVPVAGTTTTAAAGSTSAAASRGSATQLDTCGSGTNSQQPGLTDAIDLIDMGGSASEEQDISSCDSTDTPCLGAGSAADTEANSDSATNQLDLSGVEGIKSSLQEAELQKQCYPFLCWLTEPPLTPCEALVKARRIKSMSQLQPIKNTLRFIFALLHESGTIDTISLSLLSQLSACQQLSDALCARQVGHARLHAVFLLVKKILVFLSSKESASRKQFLQPSTHSESYMFVDGICSDSSFRRKQEARNRSLLGVAASQQLHRTQAAAKVGQPGGVVGASGQFRIPQTWVEPASLQQQQILGKSSSTQSGSSLTAGPGASPLAKSQVRGQHIRISKGVTSAASAQGTSTTQSGSQFPSGSTSFLTASRDRSNLASAVAAAAAAASAMAMTVTPATSDCDPSANEMSKAELRQVSQGCVQFLQQCVGRQPANTIAATTVGSSTIGKWATTVTEGGASASASGSESASSEPGHTELAAGACETMPTQLSLGLAPLVAPDPVYMAYLVTAMLCLCMAPRSQVFRQLRIGSSLVKEADGKYWVRLLADMCKNGKPTLFSIPALLTPAMDHYLQFVRPRMLARHVEPQVAAAAAASSSATAAAHDYVFCKNNGTAPRAEFSTCTSLVTTQLIGRPINAHAFRSAVITTFYSANASQADMDTLANIMSHDATTARNFYYRPVHMRAAEDTAQRMIAQLLPDRLTVGESDHTGGNGK